MGRVARLLKCISNNDPFAIGLANASGMGLYRLRGICCLI